MSNLVQKVNFQLPGSPEIKMYVYGEATLEANQEMQPVLGKLYKYENQPDMREKIREYIDELDHEYARLEVELEKHLNDEACVVTKFETKMVTLLEVKNDLKSRMMEKV